MSESFRAQAAERGINVEFQDGLGRQHSVAEATLEQLLAALGPAGQTPTESTPAPGSCFLPAELNSGGKLWGLSVQLYGLRSARNWGMGDFGDLAALIDLAAGAGAAAVQLNPLHALYAARPMHCSPYSPSSRLWLNPLYIHVPAVPELASSQTAARFVEQDRFQRRLSALRDSPKVDYPAVAAVKMPLLKLLFGEFVDRHLGQGSERDAAFEAFREAAGPGLRDFALFEALDRRLIEQHPEGWQTWPEPWRHPDSQACRDFLKRHPLEVLFPMYLQWLARTQLEQAQQRALDAGMPIGLIGDLALGVAPSGADAWRDRDLLALEVEIGAPPDAFAAEGQAWGLPPCRPQVMQERAFQPWRELLDANMTSVGGLRIDHIIGCERQFWVPGGLSGRDGAYVAYPREALLAVLAERSREHGAMVIGEDLGTVPEGFSRHLEGAAILSTRVLRFERYPSGLFRRPSTYPELACACAGTHDLPPLAAWLDSAPAEPDPDDERVLLQAALADAGTEPASNSVEDRIAAVHEFLASTPCGLVLVQLEDILAEREPANRPGSDAGQSNWQRKYSLGVDELPVWPAWDRTAALFRLAGR